MKLSVSVPDQLWEQVSTQGSSPSQVVQDALGLLVAHKQQGEGRVVTSAETRLSWSADSQDDWIGEALDGLQSKATSVRNAGYRMGIEVAADQDWLLLESIPTGRTLREKMLEWARSGYEEDDDEDDDGLWGMGERLYRCLSEWEEGLDSADNPVASVSLYDGMAAAFDDVRDAIRERMRRVNETAGLS